MFDFVEKHRRLVMFALLLVIAPAFVVVGVTTFDFSLGGANVAEVNDRPITVAEFERSLDRQRMRMEQQLGRNFDPAIFDSLELRKELLEQLITEQLLLDYANRNNASVSDAQVRQALLGFTGQSSIGKEDLERIGQAMGMTPEGLLNALRSDLIEQQLASGIQGSALISQSAAERFARARGETRTVERVVFPAGAYLGKVEIQPADIEAYYAAHQDDFRTPEQVRAAFVILDREALEKEIKISAEDIERHYNETAGPRLKAREEAYKKAEALLAELRANPEGFAEAAKKHSQDNMSAGQGGDLGFFTRGSMVKPFDDAVFKLKPQEFALVETDFGLHIIQLLEVRRTSQGEERSARHILLNAPPAAKDFAAGKADIENELRQRQLTAKFAEALENFKDIAFVQPETLQPLAERFNLKIQNSGWLSRTVGQPPLDQPKLLNALFNDEVLRDRRNSEAVEIGPGRWMVARVVEHKPASVRPLADVRGDIENMLREEKAQALAIQTGSEKLKALQAGERPDLKWSRSVRANREQASELRREELSAVFKADVRQLPAYTSLEVPRAGYVLYRISKVEPVETVSPEQLKTAATALGQLSAVQQRQVLIEDLRARADVQINEKRLAKDGQQ